MELHSGRDKSGVKNWAVGAAMAVLLVPLMTGGGCGPSKKAPKEGDVSMIPPEALAAFRREQPNAVILKAHAVEHGNWELLVSSPRREKKVYLYTPEGDLLKKW